MVLYWIFVVLREKDKIKSKPFKEMLPAYPANLLKGLDFHKVWIIEKI